MPVMDLVGWIVIVLGRWLSGWSWVAHRARLPGEHPDRHPGRHRQQLGGQAPEPGSDLRSRVRGSGHRALVAGARDAVSVPPDWCLDRDRDPPQRSRRSNEGSLSGTSWSRSGWANAPPSGSATLPHDRGGHRLDRRRRVPLVQRSPGGHRQPVRARQSVRAVLHADLQRPVRRRHAGLPSRSGLQPPLPPAGRRRAARLCPERAASTRRAWPPSCPPRRAHRCWEPPPAGTSSAPWLPRRDRPTRRLPLGPAPARIVAAMLVGTVAIYVVGLPWLAAAASLDVDKTRPVRPVAVRPRRHRQAPGRRGPAAPSAGAWWGTPPQRSVAGRRP